MKVIEESQRALRNRIAHDVIGTDEENFVKLRHKHLATVAKAMKHLESDVSTILLLPTITAGPIECIAPGAPIMHTQNKPW